MELKQLLKTLPGLYFMNIYADDIQAIIDGTTNILDIGLDLKNSEDLDCDVMSYILAVEAFDEWAEIPVLADLYDLLRLIQQEIVFSRDILVVQSCNLHAAVAFANMLFTDGMTIVKDIPRAYELLEQVIGVDPTFEYALASLGSLVLDGDEGLPRNPVKAFELFSEVLCTRPDYTFVLVKLGDMLRLGDTGIAQDEKAAYHYFQRALSAEPENLKALESMATLLKYGFDSFEPNPKKALGYFSKIIELDPDNSFALVSLADLLINYEDIEVDSKRSYELLQEALALSPNYATALGLSGELLRCGADGVICDRKKARELLERATTLDPSYRIAFASLGELYMFPPDEEEPDYDRAYSCFQRAYELGFRSVFCLNHLAELMFRHLEYDQACDFAQASLDQDPRQPYPLCILGAALRRKGDKALAARSQSCFEKALEVDPNHYFSMLYLGQMLSESPCSKQRQRACDLFWRAYEQEPSNYQVLLDLADIYYRYEQHRDVKQALYCIRKSISINSTNSHSYVLLGFIIFDQQMEELYKDGCEYLERAFELDNSHSLARYYLCRMLIVGIADVPPDIERARKLIEEFLLKSPEDQMFLELQNLLIERLLENKKSTLSKLKSFFKSLLQRA